MVKYLQNFISDGVPRMPSFTIYATNNGTDRVNFTDWDKLTNSITAETAEGEHYYKFNNDNYYLYYVLVIPSGRGTIGLAELQFYGRTLKVSVPKMDNYTTPFGKVIELGYVAGGYESYRVFDNDLSTYWQSNVNYTGMICYNFEKEVLVKNMYSIMKSPNTGVSKLEGSNTGKSNDWHSIYSDNITAGYPNTKSVLINGNLTYKYYRATITRTDDVPQVTELQFYGLDYSEREFAEGSTMKYLYDHGVELEEISLGSDATKQVDSILLSCTGDNNNACAYVQKTLTENLFRATIRNAKILKSSYLIIASNPLNVVTSDAYSNLVQENAPNNFGLDVSNFKNSNKYIGVRTQETSGAMLEILELWLE